jgi:hypothetical protein
MQCLISDVALVPAFNFKRNELQIVVAARSKARAAFARSNTEIVGSNHTGGMDVCECSVCVYSVSTPCGGVQ